MATTIKDSPGFLAEAVESILHQSYRNLEFLIVSDGELDSFKKKYLDEVKNKDNRVCILSTGARVGVAGARNLGISQAKGGFIAIMDADDISIKDRLKKQLAFIRKSGADLVGSAYFEIDVTGTVIGEKNMPQRCEDVKRTAPLFSPVNGPTVLARSEVLKILRYDERFHFGEDYRMCITLLRKGYKIENTYEKLLYFRKGPGFYTHRRGSGKARSDLLNKLYAMKLVPFYRYPLLFLFGIISSLMRLLPKRLLAVAYRIKYRLFN
jgi:glycosyltransferase involved in cell wall biosynthesis